jgi:hypothetical protein
MAMTGAQLEAVGLSEQAREAVRAQIMSSELAPGEVQSIQSVAGALGVSTRVEGRSGQTSMRIIYPGATRCPKRHVPKGTKGTNGTCKWN